MRTSPRRAGLILLTVAAAAWGPLAPSGLSAASSKSAQIQSLREQVAEASAEEAQLLDRVDEATAARLTLEERIAEVDRQLAAQQDAFDDASRRLDAVEADMVRAQLKLQRAQSLLADARHTLQRRVVAAYVRNPSAHATNLLLHVRTPRELANTQAYLEVVMRSQHEALQRYRRFRTQAEQLQLEVEERVDLTRALYNQVLHERANLEVARQREDIVRQDALRHEGNERALLDEVQQRKDEFEAQIAQLQGESDSIEDMLRSRAGDVAPPGPTPGRFVSPIPGAVVTSPFGARVHPILGTVRMHNGVDLRGAQGRPIYAAGDGEVVWAGSRGGYGNATIIDHGDGLATLYGHQSSTIAGWGDRVTAGQLIGYVGSTGFSTGPHLHFEVRAAGRPVNPRGYL